MKSSNAREVKIAFVVGDRMKFPAKHLADCSDLSLRAYRSELQSVTDEVQALTDTELDEIVGRDLKRLHRYNTALWQFGEADLATCGVWRKMGERQWVTDLMPVPDVANGVAVREDHTDRLWRMRDYAGLFI